MSYPTADSVIKDLLRERDRLLTALIGMYDSYQYEASLENPALLKAKEALQRSGISFNDDGEIIKY